MSERLLEGLAEVGEYIENMGGFLVTVPLVFRRYHQGQVATGSGDGDIKHSHPFFSHFQERGFGSSKSTLIEVNRRFQLGYGLCCDIEVAVEDLAEGAVVMLDRELVGAESQDIDMVPFKAFGPVACNDGNCSWLRRIGAHFRGQVL